MQSCGFWVTDLSNSTIKISGQNEEATPWSLFRGPIRHPASALTLTRGIFRLVAWCEPSRVVLATGMT